MTKIPRLAEWLLKRFGVPQSNESLMGDLVEERGSGRSAVWFWRETMAAIADSAARDLREHWLLAVRAIAAGWGMNLAWAKIQPVFEPLAGHRTLWDRVFTLFIWPASLFTIFVWPAIVGWVVARTHRHHQAAMVLAYAASMATLAIYRIWGLTARFAPLKGDQFEAAISFTCLGSLSTLIGGLLHTPRPLTS